MRTGIVRRIDDIGRIVIPREVRRTMNIKEGDPLEISIEDDKICLEKYNTRETYINDLKRMKDRVAEFEDCFMAEDIKEGIISAIDGIIDKL